MARDESHKRSIARNRRAKHEYVVLEDIVCGVQLRGTEVKSLRAGHASIGEAFGRIDEGELWLLGATIPEYSHGTAFNHKPTRPRKLLAHRREIDRWAKKVREKGVTIVPLEVYFQGHLVKVHIALVRGKKLYDKRQAEREKSEARDMQREMGRKR